MKGKKTFVPLDPQPERDNVVTLTRYYTPFKRDKNFRKRVSTFNCLPARHSVRKIMALVEYTGTYPKCSQTHGNAKHVSHDDVRTHHDVFEEMQQGIQNKRSNIDIYKDMVLQNLEKAPRDLQQIRSKKFHDKKKVTIGTSNIADQVLETLSMVIDHTSCKSPFIPMVTINRHHWYAMHILSLKTWHCIFSQIHLVQ